MNKKEKENKWDKSKFKSAEVLRSPWQEVEIAHAWKRTLGHEKETCSLSAVTARLEGPVFNCCC